jgi:hypothetical protein
LCGKSSPLHCFRNKICLSGTKYNVMIHCHSVQPTSALLLLLYIVKCAHHAFKVLQGLFTHLASCYKLVD